MEFHSLSWIRDSLFIDGPKLRDFSLFRFMKTPVVFDDWNCYALEEVAKHNIEYHSIGRESILRNVVSI